MKIVHTAVILASAKQFVLPLVKSDQLSHPSELWVYQPGAKLDEYLSSVIRVKNIDSLISGNIFKDLAKPILLYKAVLKTRPTVIIAHFSRGALMPLFIAFLARVPQRIYFNHGLPYLGHSGLLRKLLAGLEWFNCLFAHQIITVNKSLIPPLKRIAKNKAVSLLGPGSACGIAEHYFAGSDQKASRALKRKLRLSAEDFIFLYVGRPVLRKGYLGSFDAFLQLKKIAPQCPAKLLMAGISEQDLIKSKRKMRQDVLALGYRSDMETLYELANVVLLPTFHEGLPYSLLEAGAKRCAIIGSRLAELAEIIIEGETGYFIDHKNISQIAEVMLRAVSNPAVVAVMGDNCFKRVKKFQRENVILAYQKIIASLAAKEIKTSG